MPLTLQALKDKASERFLDLRERLKTAQANTVYATLAAAFLWPVAEAAQRGEWGALTVALSGVGGSLLANHIQNWQNEADGAWKLEQAVADNPDLRAELDTMLDQIKALPQAEHALPASDRQWFTETLRNELQGMGNFERFAAYLQGGGAIAQGTGAVAAASGGVAVGGDMHGDIYMGPPTRNPEAALAIYSRVLVDNFRHLSLRSLDPAASDPSSTQKPFDLAQVYVDLNTTTQIDGAEALHGDADLFRGGRRRRDADEESRPLSVLQAVIDHRHLVLLGDPGSGKSTFLNHLTFCLAAQRIEPQSAWLQRLPAWPAQEADIVPMFVTLRDFARWLPDDIANTEPRHLWDFIQTRLKGQNLDFVADILKDRLEQGQVLLLLDGLDEIPTAQQRTRIRNAVHAFAQRYTQCRIVVTCRKLSYQDPAWQLADFESFILAAFDEAQIDRFIAAWHAELARLGSIKPGSVDGATRQLQAAVRRPDLWRLAPNPLLLTVMALVHSHKGRLPEARALLYEETVDMLLWHWEQVKMSGEDDMPRLRYLLQRAERTDVDLKRVLWHLAFEAHRAGGTEDDEAVSDIGESGLYRTLIELHPDKSRDWAEQVIEVMKLRAGLLLEREPEVYAFPHRTFQEYLAGAHLSAQADFAQQAVRLLGEGAVWREVILLAVGRLVYLNGDTARPLSLVAELCPASPLDTDAAWRQVWLAGDVLLEMGRNRVRDSDLGRELDVRVRQRLVDLVRTGCLSPVERVAAGNSLARLGDPRFRDDAWYLPDEPLLGFVNIPAGQFIMGSDDETDSILLNASPQHKLSLPAYYIARYPVTVAQFRAYVKDSGHQPEDEESLRGLLNHSVVYITWYEAVQYCEWLTERLKGWSEAPEPLQDLLRQGWHISLPSEAEWEKAARGTDGRIYPWGEEADPNKANYNATGINATSAVGCFPGGESPHGILDISGNVWEWTRSLAGDYPYPKNKRERAQREDLQAARTAPRVLRGGAFWFDQNYARCAYRLRLDPRDRNFNFGFRVVLHP